MHVHRWLWFSLGVHSFINIRGRQYDIAGITQQELGMVYTANDAAVSYIIISHSLIC